MLLKVNTEILFFVTSKPIDKKLERVEQSYECLRSENGSEKWSFGMWTKLFVFVPF